MPFGRITRWSFVLLALGAAAPQSTMADCAGYDDSCDCDECCSARERCRCLRPNRVKIVIKRSMMPSALQGLAPVAPPVGFATASVPAQITPIWSIPISMGAPAAASASAGVTTAEIRQIIADEMRKANAAPAAATAGATQTCDDPCRDILKLRKDVDKLILVTERLQKAVDRLADDHQKKNE